MVKHGNGKLLAIGILVLLLVSLIPVAVTAAPKEKIRDAIYYSEDKCGRIAIDLNSGDYSLHCNKLAVGGDYVLTVWNSNMVLGYDLAYGLSTNSRGSIRSSGVVESEEALDFIKSQLDQGIEMYFIIAED